MARRFRGTLKSKGVEVYSQRAVKYPALHVDTQAELARRTYRRANRAISKLGRHRHDGHARVVVRRLNSADWVISLSDERGQRAALSIEYGRRPSDRDRGMEGLDIIGSILRGE